MLSDTDVLRFKTEINRLLDLGWRIHGSSSVIQIGSGGESYALFSQAFVRIQYDKAHPTVSTE